MLNLWEGAGAGGADGIGRSVQSTWRPVTSSHFEVRKRVSFTVGYGSQRPLSATWTVTGSGHLFWEKGEAMRISGVTPGKIVDMGSRDNMNMGLACARPPVIRLSGIYRILDGRRRIMTGS